MVYTRQAFQYGLKKYGIDVEDWARLFEAQEGKCAACKTLLQEGKHTHVDHDHATGKLRGLLCRGCNNALGCVHDNPMILQDLVVYLESH